MLTTSIVIALAMVAYAFIRVPRSARALVEKNMVKINQTLDVLIVRESGDEASNLLGSIQLTTRIFSKVFSAVESWADLLGRWTHEALLAPLTRKTLFPKMLGLAAAFYIVVFMLGSDKLSLPTTVRAALAGITVALLLVFYRSGLVWLAQWCYATFLGVLLASVWAFVLPFWLCTGTLLYPIRESVFSALLVDMSAEATPEGTWTVHHYVPDSAALEGLGLAHFAAHDDPRVFELIAGWIRNGKAN